MINKAEEVDHVNNIYWLSIIVVYKTGTSIILQLTNGYFWVTDHVDAYV
jgi:hypothetical protein